MSERAPASSDRVTSETDLISTYLKPLARGAAGALGLSDDAALIECEPGMDLVVSTDPIIAGVHFLPTDRADDIAWKALAVNVSDLAAKGAEPLGYTMALAFPEAPLRSWMALFAGGLKSAQTEFGLHLLGGDTDRTTGPLSISITAFGAIPRDQFVPRNGARPGDRVFVTGTLGDAALGLKLHTRMGPFDSALSDGDKGFLIGRYLRPSPRHTLAPALRAYATAALDISDGFTKDLRRMAAGAVAGIEVAVSRLPLSPPCRQALEADSAVLASILEGGDDYEILCAVTRSDAAAFMRAAREAGVQISEIGVLERGQSVRVIGDDGQDLTPVSGGFDHFAG